MVGGRNDGRRGMEESEGEEETEGIGVRWFSMEETTECRV